MRGHVIAHANPLLMLVSYILIYILIYRDSMAHQPLERTMVLMVGRCHQYHQHARCKHTVHHGALTSLLPPSHPNQGAKNEDEATKKTKTKTKPKPKTKPKTKPKMKPKSEPGVTVLFSKHNPARDQQMHACMHTQTDRHNSKTT